MTTLVTPIIAQLELDRDRFKALVNGEEIDTVQLEGRVEKSIAGQVKDRVDQLALDLNTAVSQAQAAAQNAGQYQSDASLAAQNAQQIVDAGTIAISDIVDDANQIKTDTDQIKTDTQALYDDISSIVGQTIGEMVYPVDSVTNLYPEGTTSSENLQFIASAYTPYNEALVWSGRTIEIAEMTGIDPDGTHNYSSITTLTGKQIAFNESTITFDPAKTYGWRVLDDIRFGEDYAHGKNSMASYTSWVDFTVVSGEVYIERPTLTSDITDTNSSELTPSFTASASSVVNGSATVDNTLFVVLEEGELVHQEVATGEKTSFSIPRGVLNPGRNYTTHVMYAASYIVPGDGVDIPDTTKNILSTWSDAIDFTTFDMDYKAAIDGKEDKVLSNLTATTDPTATDDNGSGYAPKSLWFNVTNNEVFRCIDASAGAAVWVKTTLTLDELGALASSDDAAGVPIADTADHFTATDVEGALQELGNGKRDQTDLNFDYVHLSTVATTTTLDLQAASIFRVDGTVNSTLTFANEPAAGIGAVYHVSVVGSGGSITWPASIQWSTSSAPSPTLDPSFTVIKLLFDGVSWIGWRQAGA